MAVEDVLLVYGARREKCVQCERNALMEVSGYFQARNERWSDKQDWRNIYLDEIPVEVFERLIKLAKVADLDEMNLNVNEMISLIKAAAYLQIGSVHRLISEQLWNHRNNPQILIWLYSSFEAHANFKLKQRARRQILSSFDDLLKSVSNAFLELDKDQWIDLLSDDNLFLTDENLLVSCLSYWIAHNEPHRSRDFTEIFKHIRTTNLNSPQLMDTIHNHPSVVQEFLTSLAHNPTQMNAIPRTTQVLLLTDSRVLKLDLSTNEASVFQLAQLDLKYEKLTSSRHMITFSAHNMLYGHGSTIWSLSLADGAKSVLFDGKSEIHSKKHLKHAVGFLDGVLYTFYWSFYPRITMLSCFNVSERKVTKEMSIPERIWKVGRCSFKLLAHNGRIYFFARDAYFYYHPESDTWSDEVEIGPNQVYRSVCVGPDGYIFLLGYNLRGQKAVDVCLYRIDPSHDSTWTVCGVPVADDFIQVLPCEMKIVFLNGMLMLITEQFYGANIEEYRVNIYNHLDDVWIVKTFSLSKAGQNLDSVAVIRVLTSKLVM